MQLRRLRGHGLNDPLLGTAPIFKLSRQGVAQLIGSGVWVTSHGHLLTAWHVIQDNIGNDGIDEGPIFAVQTLPDRTVVVRSLRKSCKHDSFDLALSETLVSGGSAPIPTVPHALTMEEPAVGARIHTHSFLPPDQDFSTEHCPGLSNATFRGTLVDAEQGIESEMSFTARVSFGTVTERFDTGRDKVMLPFPCYQSDMPLYGANSGGPVFDERGRVFGINCSSYAGATDLSFHVSMKGVLELWARNIELIPEDPVPRQRSVLELGLARRIPFAPALSKMLFPLPVRMLLWPYHRVLDLWSALRWEFYQVQLRVASEAKRRLE